jgi:hypothetical protein
MISLRRAATLLPLLVIGLAGCATLPGGGGTDPVPAPAPETVIAAPGEVRGQGTVIQVADAAPEFCLGAVMESYPPQCSGPELVGWDWDTVDGEETSGEVTFGTYAVSGTWDGTKLTVTGAIMLALYDPIPFVDPLLDPENAGDVPAAELERIQAELTAEGSPLSPLTTWIENGYVFATVLYDDGSIQAWADSSYVPDAVAIRSALRDIN